jgi:putative pyruvate formate lyase activating enzyme
VVNAATNSGLDRALIRARAARAREGLRCCALCERRCGVDRSAGERAPCGLGDQTWCFKRHVSYAEELELLPSYMVYLVGCNFRCRFCVQAPQCFAPADGVRIDPVTAAAGFAGVVGRGARTINLLGGEPSLHLHTILEIAAEAPEALPLVLNTNMYMTPEVIDLLDGVVSLYIADFKFGGDRCAEELAGVQRYTAVVTRNLLRVAPRTRLIVRHLLMPGHLDCCFRPVVRWLAENLPDTPFTLMTGYVPAWRAARGGPLNRCLTADEVDEAERLLGELGVRRSG